MSRLFLITVLFVIHSGFCTKAQWNDFIINHRKESFGNGSQTWQIDTFDDKYVFCSNKNGLLYYNGDRWRLLTLNNKSDARSLHVSGAGSRIYVGGEGEFGYFALNPAGCLTYRNLSDAYDDGKQFIGAYWGIYEIDNLMYYVSDRHVVKQQVNETSFSTIHAEFKIDCSAVVNGVLYTGSSSGIAMLVGNTWMYAAGSDLVRDKMIRAIVPWGDGYLIATAFDGIFYGDEKRIVPFRTGFEEFMRRYEVFSLAANDRYIAVGTIHKGLLIVSADGGGRTYYYNVQNGLQNNTVLSIRFDGKDGLWAGLDNGIDYISLDMPLTNLYTAPYSKGAGYTALRHDRMLYLGTNRGLFYTEWPVSFTEDAIDPHFIPELSGQVWGLERVGDEIFCLHDKGVFSVRENRVTEIKGLRGGLTAWQHPEDPDRCWVGTYDGLFLLARRPDGGWVVDKHIDGVAGWMKDCVFESAHRLWLRDGREGVIRFDLDGLTNELVSSEAYHREDGFESTDEIRLHRFLGNTYFSNASGIYRYDAPSNRIVKDERLNELLPGNRAYSKIISLNHTLYAVSSDILSAVVFCDHTPCERTVSLFNASQIGFIKWYENIVAVDDSLLIVPNEFGFALFNNRKKPHNEMRELFIKNVALSYPKDSTLYRDNFLNKTSSPQIAYRKNAIRFEYAVRNSGNRDDIPYRYRLLPDERWSEPTVSATKEYGNLHEGHYTFEVEALMPDVTFPACRFSFTVLPPWYRSAYAVVLYILLSAGVLYIIYIADRQRIVRKRKADLAHKDREIRLKEEMFLEEQKRKEQEIFSLQKEKLEQELQFKSQEMANLLINFTRKNEMLIDIKQGLQKISSAMRDESSVKAKRMILTLNNRIDSNIASDDALKRFEEQFNLVHNNFIRKVKEKHADLSTNELKMCAYVKMELSSKEIAPLLSLSIRGVETLRYRLRKRMGLEREESLTKYLNSF
jgi:DNA-binding CsgD family transcriptional regulator